MKKEEKEKLRKKLDFLATTSIISKIIIIIAAFLMIGDGRISDLTLTIIIIACLGMHFWFGALILQEVDKNKRDFNIKERIFQKAGGIMAEIYYFRKYRKKLK